MPSAPKFWVWSATICGKVSCKHILYTYTCSSKVSWHISNVNTTFCTRYYNLPLMTPFNATPLINAWLYRYLLGLTFQLFSCLWSVASSGHNEHTLMWSGYLSLPLAKTGSCPHLERSFRIQWSSTSQCHSNSLLGYTTLLPLHLCVITGFGPDMSTGIRYMVAIVSVLLPVAEQSDEVRPAEWIA